MKNSGPPQPVQLHTPLWKLLAALILIIVGLVGAFAFWHHRVLSAAAHQIARYNGDGEIRDRSSSYLYLPLAGYEIKFKSFPLDQPFSHSYTLKDLPVIKNDTLVFFRVFRESGIRYKQPFGTISLRITDSKGKSLVSIKDVAAEDFIWTEAGNNPFALYLLDYPATVYDSDFEPQKGETYTLEVDFTPVNPSAPNAKPATGGKGALYISAGGYL